MVRFERFFMSPFLQFHSLKHTSRRNNILHTQPLYTVRKVLGEFIPHSSTPIMPDEEELGGGTEEEVEQGDEIGGDRELRMR